MIKKYIDLALFFAAAFLLITCQKDYDLPSGNNKVVLNASATDSVSYFTVKIQSRLANTANYTISDYDLCWGLEPNPKITDNKISNGYTAQPADISASLKDLLPGKKYYIRSFATIPTGTVYGAQSEFTTLKTGIPVSVTDTITDITYTTALCKGIVLADSGLMVTKRGICWSLTPNPTLTSHFDTLGKGLGTYDIQIDALNPSSTYYIRAFAVNDSGTSYGIQKSFITVALTPPTLTTTPVTNITTTTAESGGNITADGGSPITARGICWGILPNPTTANSHTTDGTEMGIFTSSLTALTPNTSYYVRAYATNAVGTSYGDAISFTSLPIVLPSLTTADINNITINTAGSGGNITSDGGDLITERGVCWSVNQNPTITNSHSSDGTGSGIFTSSLTGLINNTIYYVRAFATNSAGTAYGNELSFKTIAEITIPTVTTTTPTNILSNRATTGGNVTSTGGASVIVRGVCYSTSLNPTIDADHTTDGSGSGIFTSNLTSLNPTTTYHIRAYATNSSGTAYGQDLSFTTTANTAPILTTTAITAITPTTASSGGNITESGGATVTARGVCWSTTQNPTIAGSHTTDGTGTGIFTSALTNLNPTTTYYVRAYATNSVGTSYGNELTFTTTSSATAPTVSTTAVTAITSSMATSGGNVTNSGGATVTARGVCWSTLHDPTTANSHTTDGTGTGIFTSALTNLNPSTTYYIRAYATNNVGTSYGTELTFVTLSATTPPILTTTAATNIAATTATSGGNITSDGGATVTARGVCWSTSQTPTTADSHTTDGTGTGIFVSSITGLNAATTYYVRAYATNSVETAYGNQVSFTTLAWTCGSTITINHVTGSVAPVDKTVTYGTVTNIPGEPTKCWITSNLGADHQATSVNDATEASAGWYWQFNRKQGYKHDGTTRTPNTTWITSINENLDWQAANDPCALELGGSWRLPAGTEWTNVDASGNWINCEGPWNSGLKMHEAGYIDHTNGSLALRGSYGYYWANNQYQSNSDWGWFIYFNGNMCQLGGTYKSMGFSVRCINGNSGANIPTLITASISSITSNSAISGGDVINDGGATVNARGVCWSTNQTPTIADSHTSDGTGTGIFVSNINGLNAATTYYVRAYATNSEGTAYGNQQSFTTLAWACGSTITINHIAGSVAPVYKIVTYGTVTNIPGEPTKCWITSNLGADHQATSVDDATEASAGWYWQFNRKQGYKHDGTTRTPNTTWITPISENSDWLSSNDPCTIELGSGWRIPTNEELTNIDTYWNSSSNAWNSDLKLHAAGTLGYNNGTLDSRGSYGFYWSRNQMEAENSYVLSFDMYTHCGLGGNGKASGFPIRCINGGSGTAIPILTTTSISNSTSNSATSGGNITSDGGATVTARGVCWSTNQTPTTADSHTSDGTGTGTFVSSITGLNATTTYYVRAYATNSVGTAYGNQQSFTTLSGFICGTSFTINHVAGTVSPVSKTVTYGTVTNIPGEISKCWITQNLGAYQQATSVNDASEPSAGWYWQFNLKQGYKHDGTTRTPNTTWITSINENSDWISINDPCSIELGSVWRIPTNTEWTNIDAIGNWTDWNGPWNSLLKLHAAGYLLMDNGGLISRGANGVYWSSIQQLPNYSWHMSFYITGSNTANYRDKSNGEPLRCIHD
jgi:hypothetical protein